MPAPTPPSDVASNSLATSAWANAVADAVQQLIADLYPAGALAIPWANVTGKPALFAPSVHAHRDAASGGTVAYGDLAGKPATFAPAGHALDPSGNPAHTGTLPWASVSGKPATFAPAAHALDPNGNPAHTGTVPWASVGGKPALWNKSASSSGATIYTQPSTTPPGSPVEGDVWIKG
jgi:hypothetical protein